jgi:hypothetical protein
MVHVSQLKKEAANIRKKRKEKKNKSKDISSQDKELTNNQILLLS